MEEPKIGISGKDIKKFALQALVCLFLETAMR